MSRVTPPRSFRGCAHPAFSGPAPTLDPGMLRLLLLSASYAPLAPILITLRLTDVPLSVKFGALRDPAGAFVGFDARPAAIKNFLAYSLRRLGTDIDLYQPARVDRTMPIEDIVGAIAELVRAGYVGHTGLSEASAVTVRRARCPSHRRARNRLFAGRTRNRGGRCCRPCGRLASGWSPMASYPEVCSPAAFARGRISTLVTIAPICLRFEGDNLGIASPRRRQAPSSATNRHAAAELGAGPEHVAQHPEERRVAVDVRL
jgi:hypothetical protein